MKCQQPRGVHVSTRSSDPSWSLDESSFTPNSLQLLQVSSAARAHTRASWTTDGGERAQAGWGGLPSPRDHWGVKKWRHELVWFVNGLRLWSAWLCLVRYPAGLFHFIWPWQRDLHCTKRPGWRDGLKLTSRVIFRDAEALFWSTAGREIQFSPRGHFTPPPQHQTAHI